MNTFACVVLLATCVLAAPAPEESKRDKRGLLSYGHHGLGYHGLDSGLALSSYSLGPSLLSHERVVYSAPAAVVHEPAVVSVKKIVSVPHVVSVKKLVSVPRVLSSYSYAPRVRYSYAPSYSAYSAPWW